MARPAPKEEFCTTRELAQLLKISLMTVHLLADSGAISFHRIGKSKRFRIADVHEHIDTLEQNLRVMSATIGQLR